MNLAMTGKPRAPKFHRETPAVRREALVEATLRSLKEFGHDGASIRRIAKAADVSIGLINHHFQSKSELIAAAYETLATSLQQSMRAKAEDAGLPPRERLSGFFRASFAPEILDPEIFSVWLVFWSMVMHSAEMQVVHDRTYRRYRAILESALTALAASGAAPPFAPRRAAIALSALLDGLWVELSLSASTFTAPEAIAICEDWVHALCAGAMPALLLEAEPGPAAVQSNGGPRG
jgi:transcriptional repressor BetI